MENARRLTVSLDDQTYVRLVDYAAELSKRRMGKFSLNEALRDLVAKALAADREDRRKANPEPRWGTNVH